jgi:hypothetical protein
LIIPGNPPLEKGDFKTTVSNIFIVVNLFAALDRFLNKFWEDRFGRRD